MADGVGRRYLDMEAQGCLRTYPGRVLPVVEFLQAGASMVDGQTIRSAGCDRYRGRLAAPGRLPSNMEINPMKLAQKGTGIKRQETCYTDAPFSLQRMRTINHEQVTPPPLSGSK